MAAAETNRYVPLRVRITGTLSDDDLERLGAAIRRTVAQRIALAERTVGGAAASAERVAEGWSAENELPRETAYSLPWYDRAGHREGVRVQQRESAEQTAILRIHALLSTGLFDWWITDDEAHEVLQILRRLPAGALMTVVQTMRFSGDWRSFSNLPSADWDVLDALEQTIGPQPRLRHGR